MVLLLIACALAATACLLWYLPRNKGLFWKLTARIPAGILMCASALVLLGFLFRGAMCGRYEFPPVSSSDGQLTAQLREVDCGAVDSFHSSVQLRWNRRSFVTRLFGKQENSTTVFTVGHDPRLIDLAWKDDRTLLIHYPNDSRYVDEFRCQSGWEGVHIECVGYLPDNKPVGAMPPVQRWLW
jgi:hypothetical protein